MDKSKEFLYSLINSNDQPPRIYIVAGAIAFVVALVYNIVMLTVSPMMRLIMVGIEVGSVAVAFSVGSLWWFFKRIKWYLKEVKPDEETLERLDTTIVPPV